MFAAAVLGGLGSLPGAVAGALVLGVAEDLTAAFLSPAYREGVGFLVILVVLTRAARRPARGARGARGMTRLPVVFILAVCGAYALLAQSLVVSWGLAGLPNLGLAGFFAVGGYAAAMLGRWAGLAARAGAGRPRCRWGRWRVLVVTAATLAAARRLPRHRHARLCRGPPPGAAERDGGWTGGADGISGVPVAVPARLGRQATTSPCWRW